MNKVSSGVRITHEPSGAVAASCLTRDQFRNKRDAFRKMAESKPFQVWVRTRAAELNNGRTIAQLVDDSLEPHNLKIEYRTVNGWEDVD